MLKIYLVLTLGLFAGWIRMIPAFEHRKYLRGILFSAACATLTWSGMQVAAAATAQPEKGWILLAGMGGYMLFLSVIFYNMTTYFKNREKNRRSGGSEFDGEKH